MKKKILSIISCFTIALLLTACGGTAEPLLDENGDIIHYTEEGIQSGNYYIMKDDGMYYKILNVPTGEDSLGTLYTWFCEPYDAAIPRFTNKDRLMFYSDTDRPGSLTLYKMTDYAYTVGALFSVENNTGDLKHPQIISFTDTFNTQSPVGEVVNAAITPNSTTYITGINNHEFTANLLVDDSFLKGLTKDTMYQIEFYCGTVRKTVNVKADTHLFLREAAYTTASYEELKSKVFEIYLPQNLAPGYYYAEGVGMFYFEGTLDDLDEDDIEKMLENEDSEESKSVNDGEVQPESEAVTSEAEQTDSEGGVLDDLSNESDDMEDAGNSLGELGDEDPEVQDMGDGEGEPANTDEVPVE